MIKFVIRKPNDWSFEKQLKLEVLLAPCFWLLLKYVAYPPTLYQTSILPWWSLCYFLVLNTWPKLLQLVVSKETYKSSKIIQLLRHGGPLGTNCSKLIETLTGILLWIGLHNGQFPPITIFGPNFIENVLYDKLIWIVVIVLSAGVNGVLYLWSSIMNSRGNHNGVNDMISPTQGRKLLWNETCYILLLALVNATVEEITSRFLYMYEFTQCSKNTTSSSDNARAHRGYGNVLQATIFGISHYHGIPSGMTGVMLTFVYGLIMGYLYQYNMGDSSNSGDYDGGGALFLPILVHTIADYYIFAIIARRKESKD